ncbi:CU044_5270 family protein [Planobispora siamensis]|nr:CU044_5270 family protein [Planobispora siamensis]
MSERTFALLKPGQLDELAEETYRRRRSADLARAFEALPAPARVRRVPERGRRPLVLAAGAAAAGLAAAVIIIPGQLNGAPGGREPGPGVSAGDPRSGGARPIDAHSILLAAAESAAREPAGSGRYWYTRQRVFQRVDNAESDYMVAIKALAAEREEKLKELKGKPDELAAAEREFERKVGELKRKIGEPKSAALSYTAFLTQTDESWRPRQKGATGRSVSGQDEKITFASSGDEAKWRQAGAPDLGGSGPRSYDDATERVLSIDNPGLNMRNVGDLPTDREELERKLRQFHKARPGGAQGDFAVYLWQTGVDLLSAPITPGTKAALFQVMADQPGMTSPGQVTDATGRAGAALTATGSGDDGERIEYRLIVDPDSAELLQYEVGEAGTSAPLLRVTLQEAGWVDRLGDRP